MGVVNWSPGPWGAQSNPRLTQDGSAYAKPQEIRACEMLSQIMQIHLFKTTACLKLYKPVARAAFGAHYAMQHDATSGNHYRLPSVPIQFFPHKISPNRMPLGLDFHRFPEGSGAFSWLMPRSTSPGPWDTQSNPNCTQNFC